MPEPMSTQLVATELERLMIAFPRGRAAGSPQQLADVYRNGLSGLGGDALRWAVKTAIQEDQYFPKVSRLRQLAQRWTTANQVTVGPVAVQDRRCPTCGMVPRPEMRWRPKVTENGRRILDGAGRMLLEQFERVRCDCDAPPRYEPDDPTTEYMTEDRRRPAA